MDEKSNLTSDTSATVATDVDQAVGSSVFGDQTGRFNHINKGKTILIFLASTIIVLSLTVLFFFGDKTNLISSKPKTLSERIIDLNKENLKSAETGGPLAQEDLNNFYLESIKKAETYNDENKSKQEFIRFNSYFAVFQHLTGQYYSTRDPKIYKEAKELRDFIKTNFPELYKGIEQENIKVWEIVE